MSRRTAPISWTSQIPHLTGNFAPIGTELDVPDLAVTSGRVPVDLAGSYLRNGPNPEFEPISYTYPLDGDGMVHAVRFDAGRVGYKNRFVETRGLRVERRAGRAVYGGLMRPGPVDPALVGNDGETGMVKAGAFVSVVSLGGKLIALGEAQPAYEMSSALDTIGEWTAGTDRVLRIGAHNHRHPRTGELYGICYSGAAPVVYVHRIARDGVLAQTFEVPLAMPSMIHDFVLTEHWLVLVVGPAVFDRGAKPVLQYREHLGTRIACVPLDGGPPRTIETDAFFVFHFANGHERGDELVIDYVRHARFGLGPASEPGAPPTLHRMVIDPARGEMRDSEIAAGMTEFPRIDAARDGLPHRFVYLPMRSSTSGIASPPSGTFNTLAKLDVETGAVTRHDFGARIVGEATFVPRPGQSREDDGYLIAFAYDPAREVSDAILLDAAHVDAEPVAVIAVPQRVPQGLHGIWIPA